MTCLRGSVIHFNLLIYMKYGAQGHCVFGLVSIDLCHNNNDGVGGLRPSPAAIVGEWSLRPTKLCVAYVLYVRVT